MVGEALNSIKEIKEYAKLENVPIMQDDGIEFLTTFIIKNQVKTVLEIGTAIGYSAIKMALSSTNLKIVSNIFLSLKRSYIFFMKVIN